MLLRTLSYRPWLASALLVALFTIPTTAQPPSPLELVRGLREHGQIDLALEYLKDLEGKPLSDDDKAAILLERSKCLLEGSEDEPDEATRLGMVSEAREGLRTFLLKHPNHPRAIEARLTDAKLIAVDAREQLNRARRMDIPAFSEDPEEKAAREAAMAKQKAEAKKAQPMFLNAAKQFNEASVQLRARLEDKALDPALVRLLNREAFEAELASGINQFNTAETYMPSQLVTGAEKAERNKFLEQSKDTFTKLAKGPPNNRTVWIARAWAAEVTFEQDDFNTAAGEVQAILRSSVLEAEDGKRLARFFQLRRNFVGALGEKNLQKVIASETELRNWLRQYGNPRKPTPELYAVRYYLARILQSLAENSIGPPPKDGRPVVVTGQARARLEEAERLYRGLGQTDHEYTSRATRQRMAVVRRILGEADQPLSTFDSFEKAQMASLIQLSKLAQAEAAPQKFLWVIDLRAVEIQNRRQKAISLLERSRELATPQDNPADVTDVLLRLIYFYQLSDQPHQAAVLGDHVAHTIKSTGGKAAFAGLLSLNGYLLVSRRAKDAESRVADRERAIAMAKFLDDKLPNDAATDAARHQLASLYFEDKKPLEAFDSLLKVRPNYQKINDVRLFEGYVVSQLLNPKSDADLADAKKAEIFHRAIVDLAKIAKPAPVAVEEDVRTYISARYRMALLMLSQSRVDPGAEKANPGYNQSIRLADDLVRDIPTFNAMTEAKGAAKDLSLDGMEMMMLALDVQARGTYLRARALTDAADKLPAAERQPKYDEAAAALQPIVDAVDKKGPLVSGEIATWATGGGGENAEQKAKIGQLAGVVDKTRVDAILAAFRIKVKQAKAAEADALLELMKKAGGSIENSLPLLEPVGKELAVQIAVYRREGKKAEADALGAGLAVLMKKITTVQNLTPPTILFVGQMLLEVGEFDKAMEMLKKIKPPEFAGWQTKKPEEFPAELKGRILGQIRDYASASVGIARGLREGKKFKEAEDLLVGIIGTNDKPGWGSGRLYFRKELALVYEDWAATVTAVKDANVMWGKGLKEWTTIYSLFRNRMAKMQPPGKDATPDQVASYKRQLADAHNDFADAFFDVNRCLVKANQQLLKAQPPEKLQKTYDDVGKKFADLEKQIPQAEWQPEVQHRYADLLKEIPQIAAPYKAAGGKFFLDKMPVRQ